MPFRSHHLPAQPRPRAIANRERLRSCRAGVVEEVRAVCPALRVVADDLEPRHFVVANPSLPTVLDEEAAREPQVLVARVNRDRWGAGGGDGLPFGIPAADENAQPLVLRTRCVLAHA